MAPPPSSCRDSLSSPESSQGFLFMYDLSFKSPTPPNLSAHLQMYLQMYTFGASRHICLQQQFRERLCGNKRVFWLARLQG